MAYGDDLHLWVGQVNEDEETYLKHFELDYSVEDIDDPEYRVCDFSKLIGQRWYDEDFIGIIPLWNELISISDALVEAPISSEDKEIVLGKCRTLGLENINAILWYECSDVAIADEKQEFFGLKYLGKYEGD